MIIGDKKLDIPIIQGGMGVGFSMSQLASAVAKEGGIGVIATAGIGFNEPDFGTNYREANIRALRKEIRKARELCDGGLLGVNIMVALTNYSDMVKASIEEGIDFIFSGAGLPLKLPGIVKEVKEFGKTMLVPIISSARALKLIVKTWWKNYNYLPDAVVIEGPKAGGHLGFKYEELLNNEKFKLIDIFNSVKEYIVKIEEDFKRKIPIFVGGGIFDRKDAKIFKDRGVDGFQIGTRFVATYESDAHDIVKEMYVKAKKEDVILIKSPVGLPGRALKNKFLEAVSRGEKIPFKCPYHCIKTCNPATSPFCIAGALINAVKGNMDNGFAFAGTNVSYIKDILTVKEVIKDILG